jgi:hypothetical protein
LHGGSRQRHWRPARFVPDAGRRRAPRRQGHHQASPWPGPTRPWSASRRTRSAIAPSLRTRVKG